MSNKNCPTCKGTGSTDSGGVTPWGESIDVPCECLSSEADTEQETIYDRDVRAIVVAMIGLAKHTTGYTWTDLVTHSEAIGLEMQKQRKQRKGLNK
jgi:hypothetical protein